MSSQKHFFSAPIDHSAIPSNFTVETELTVIKETAATKTGAAIQPKGDTLWVSNVPPNTPAKIAGLMKGDYIVAVDGNHGYLNDLVEQMGSKVGEMVLGVKRGKTHLSACLSSLYRTPHFPLCSTH